MRILVTGCHGQLGFDCLRELQSRGYKDVLGVDIQDFDISDRDAVTSFLRAFRPTVIMHNAAWTAVDKAELFPDKVRAINAFGPGYLAEAGNEIGAKMVFISTDYVFPGVGDRPFEIDSETGPRSIYGMTKLEGEELVRKNNPRHFIVRTSWVFGKSGNNFVKTMLNLGREQHEIEVVDDQIGSPTYSRDLAKLLCDMIVTEKYGTYHATNEGFCSWATFAVEVFKVSGMNVHIKGISTKTYLKKKPNQAIRPLNSRLSKVTLDKAGFSRLPAWQDALREYLKELNG